MSSTNASATSAITTLFRSRRPPPSPSLRPLWRSVEMRSGRDARSAGITPNNAAATSAANIVYNSTPPSIPTYARLGMSCGPIATSMPIPAFATSQPEHRTAHGEHERFGEHLPHEPRAAAAERRAHRQLALTTRRAHQDEVRDVRARDEQHERHGAEQRDERGLHLRHQLGVHWYGAEIDAGGGLDREFLAQIDPERVELRLCLAERRTRLEAPDETEDHVDPRSFLEVEARGLEDVVIARDPVARREEDLAVPAPRRPRCGPC